MSGQLYPFGKIVLSNDPVNGSFAGWSSYSGVLYDGSGAWAFEPGSHLLKLQSDAGPRFQAVSARMYAVPGHALVIAGAGSTDWASAFHVRFGMVEKVNPEHGQLERAWGLEHMAGSTTIAPPLMSGLPVTADYTAVPYPMGYANPVDLTLWQSHRGWFGWVNGRLACWIPAVAQDIVGSDSDPTFLSLAELYAQSNEGLGYSGVVNSNPDAYGLLQKVVVWRSTARGEDHSTKTYTSDNFNRTQSPMVVQVADASLGQPSTFTKLTVNGAQMVVPITQKVAALNEGTMTDVIYKVSEQWRLGYWPFADDVAFSVEYQVTASSAYRHGLMFNFATDGSSDGGGLSIIFSSGAYSFYNWYKGSNYGSYTGQSLTLNAGDWVRWTLYNPQATISLNPLTNQRLTPASDPWVNYAQLAGAAYIGLKVERYTGAWSTVNTHVFTRDLTNIATDGFVNKFALGCHPDETSSITFDALVITMPRSPSTPGTPHNPEAPAGLFTSPPPWSRYGTSGEVVNDWTPYMDGQGANYNPRPLTRIAGRRTTGEGVIRA